MVLDGMIERLAVNNYNALGRVSQLGGQHRLQPAQAPVVPETVVVASNSGGESCLSFLVKNSATCRTRPTRSKTKIYLYNLKC
ncbi:hypothetical protein pipiens_005251 [Culex pipiens pipiens]|uniref:Uncharacterized protein n=1 Tax=Culex pipiens pipiens TaxID=38569 RepID=A0ABD1DY72_CULPP